MSAHVTWTVLDAARGLLLGVGEFNPATHTQKDASNNDVLVGLAAPVGSLFIDASAGTLYQKTGTDATAWTALGGGAFVPIDGSVAMTGMLTLAAIVNALKLPNNARLVSVNTSAAQAGELILVASDNGTYITLAPGGVFNIRNSAQVILAQVDTSGNVKAHGDVTAFGV